MRADEHEEGVRCFSSQQVQFHIKDVYVPEPDQILMELHGQDLLQGRVVDFSDRGGTRKAFAVVEVSGFTGPVVVPVAKVMRLEG